jgi:DNA-binding NtrC family response regulator
MKARILVVDDAPEVLVMMTEVLHGAEYEVLAAATFEEGRRLAREANPDVIVVDVRLGAKNGLELAIIEHLDHPSRPLIVMSGHPDPALQAEATKQSAVFLEKPIEVDHLLRLIASMLAPRRTARMDRNGGKSRRQSR